MFTNKFLITLLGILLAVFAIYKNNVINEGFLGNLPSMTVKVDRVASNGKGDFYSVPGTYQSLLAPRMNAGLDYGANIRYNPPSEAMMAVPSNPLSMGDMVQENYGCGSCSSSVPSCLKGGAPSSMKAPVRATDAGFAAGDFNQVASQAYQSSEYPETSDMLPVPTMSSVNALGEVSQPIIYDRFMVANRNSRLRSQGDPIRGDLPIVPCSASWFRPSVHPQIDLQEGAMNVMGGVNNETTKSLAALIAAASAGTDTSISGVDMSNEFGSVLGAGLNDLTVTAFP